MTLRTKQTLLTNFAIEWMILLFRICEVPGWNLDSVPPGKCHKNTFLVSANIIFSNTLINQHFNICNWRIHEIKKKIPIYIEPHLFIHLCTCLSSHSSICYITHAGYLLKCKQFLDFWNYPPHSTKPGVLIRCPHESAFHFYSNPHESGPPPSPIIFLLRTSILESYSHLCLGLPSISFRFPYLNFVCISLIFHLGHMPNVSHIFYTCESTQYVWKPNLCLGLPGQSSVIPKILTTVADIVILKYESLD